MGGSKMKGRTTICVLAAAVCLLDSLTRADVDDNDYAWDPNDRTGSKASTAADMEGTLEAPSNLWHACKFGAKKGGIFDLRGLSRNAKLLQAHLGWNTDKFNDKIQLYDWVHQDVTQFNVDLLSECVCRRDRSSRGVCSTQDDGASPCLSSHCHWPLPLPRHTEELQVETNRHCEPWEGNDALLPERGQLRQPKADQIDQVCVYLLEVL